MLPPTDKVSIRVHLYMGERGARGTINFDFLAHLFPFIDMATYFKKEPKPPEPILTCDKNSKF